MEHAEDNALIYAFNNGSWGPLSQVRVPKYGAP